MINAYRDLICQAVKRLAENGVFIGTSSWKYEGWRGILYDDARYVYRGRFAKSRFERHCLLEYAEVFKTVCVDAAYYVFPSASYLQDMAAQTPSDFRFAFKVTDDITLKKFPNLPRFGVRAGTQNPHFLSAEIFEREFLRPCDSIRSKIGILLFEFSRFYSTDFEHGKDFVAALDDFLKTLPKGWPYGIEMRNKTWLKPEYFECLARHGVTHVYNSWTDMPPIGEQMKLLGSETTPHLSAARFLLKPGRSYEEAIKSFQPYSETREINEPARQAGAELIRKGKTAPGKKTFLFINNRLEGNALQTIKAMLEMSG